MIKIVSILIDGKWRDFAVGETLSDAGTIEAIEIKDFVCLHCANGDIYYVNVTFIAKTFKP